MITHCPHGIEHPYATSPDQRVPVLPLTGTPVLLGIVASPDVTRVVCEWGSTELELEPVKASAADAAALAGGEGHLSEAQANALGAEGAWSVLTPPVTTPTRYRFRAERSAGAERATTFAGGDPNAFSGAADGTTRDVSAAIEATDTTGASAVEFTEWFEVPPAEWRSVGGEVRGGGDRVRGVE